MKTRIYLIAMLFAIYQFGHGQPLPNGSFSTWVSETTPYGWITLDDILPITPTAPYASRDSVHKRDNSPSIKLVTRQEGSMAYGGMVALGSGNFTNGPEFEGIPYQFRPDTLFFSYSYTPVNGDSALAYIRLKKQLEPYIMYAQIPLTSTNGQWVDVAFPLSDYYHSQSIPDSLVIIFSSSYDMWAQVGSVLNVDAVSFSGVGCNYAGIGGQTLLDINNNHTADGGDITLSNQLITLSGGRLAYTNQGGLYQHNALPGTYIVKPVVRDELSGAIITPDSIVVNADSACEAYMYNDFVVTPPAGFCSGRLAIVRNGAPPRPGFTNEILIELHNTYSGAAINATVTLYYDSAQQFVSSFAGVVSVDSINRRITLHINSLASSQSAFNYITFYTPASVPLGNIITYHATVSNSGCAGFDSLEQVSENTVVGSYDPNDKNVTPAGVGPGGDIPSSTPLLTYTIRFQNTGSYPAQDVMIVDTISNLLDITTLKVLSFSFPYEVLINGREVTFKFPNIMLPDSFNNEPESHGYIQYSIEPTNAFVQGSRIENLADIYFDFNTPVRTNTAISTANNFLSITKVRSQSVIDIFPNPASDKLNISADAAIERLRIYNTEGKLMLDVKQPANRSFDISQLIAGTYIAEVTINKTTVKKQFVKM